MSLWLISAGPPVRDRKRPFVGLSALAAGVLIAGSLAAGCGSGRSDTGGSGGGSGAPLGTTSAVTATVTTADTKYGTILVDGSGRTLYLFEKDRPNQSECTGACAADWPIFHGNAVHPAGAGVQAALLGTIKRSDSTTQVTYNSHPLYYYSDDAGRPGEIRGQNVSAFGAKWYVVAPTGNRVTGGGS